MKEGSSEMHSDDDKSHLEKNKKRVVKTRAQVEALEKFYNEHKYPTEAMKIQVAESIGLTEKQVSGWFCHRRLKDKKFINGENHATGRQDRSSGVIQDRGSGLRQDSCSSTKQGDERNFDNREVESGRFTPKEFSATEIIYEHDGRYPGNHNHTNDPSSGSSSSLRNISTHLHGDPLDAPTSGYAVPKFARDATVKRSGPSGYLKLKGRVENPAISAVKRQLGKQYRGDGPPLGVQFDPLPPGAFGSSPNEAVEGDNLAAPDDVIKNYRNTSFGKVSEYKSRMASYSNMDGTSDKMLRGCDTPDSYIHQRYQPRTLLNSDVYYHPRNNSSVELTDGSTRDNPTGKRKYESGAKPRPGIEVSRINTFSSPPHPHPYGRQKQEERTASCFHKYNDAGKRVTSGKYNVERSPNFSLKRKEYCSSVDVGRSEQIVKDAKTYSVRSIKDENGFNAPYSYPLTAWKRMKGEFPQVQQKEMSSASDNPPQMYQGLRSAAEMPSSFSDDDKSAETSSSVD